MTRAEYVEQKEIAQQELEKRTNSNINNEAKNIATTCPNKIANFEKIIGFALIIIGGMSALILFMMNDFEAGMIGIGVVVSTIFGAGFFFGMSEIIQLLQAIKDKKD